MNKIVYAKQYAASIIDIFESYLDEKGITIPNEERDKDEELENGANIYGDDFDILENDILTELEYLMKESHACEGYNITSYSDDEEHNILFSPIKFK